MWQKIEQLNNHVVSCLDWLIGWIASNQLQIFLFYLWLAGSVLVAGLALAAIRG